MGKFMAHATHGRDDPERATLPFIAANVAASADQEAIVLLTIEGVWLATKGYADDVHHPGMPPLREVLDSLVASGGQVWACGACTKPRGITDEDMIEGARIISAADFVAEMVDGTPLFTV
ncbi:MAG TPA: DsrE family protein [Candidatus Limnocylindria bacterium]|jgi:predicted peroxiredoxin|nr:DsrE family protein [Candidatus Limnocylindria bacterium]